MIYFLVVKVSYPIVYIISPSLQSKVPEPMSSGQPLVSHVLEVVVDLSGSEQR